MAYKGEQLNGVSSEDWLHDGDDEIAVVPLHIPGEIRIVSETSGMTPEATTALLRDLVEYDNVRDSALPDALRRAM